MKFSCIMTTFNDGPIMRQSVDSVLAQSHRALELLIVDDGSDADTKAYLKTIDDPRVVHLSQANDGLSSARNRALRHATGDYICFLDADDVRAPWSFADVARAAADSPDELIFVRGVLSEHADPLSPFYDEPVAQARLAALSSGGPDDLAARKVWATLHEPQSANKFLSRALVERAALSFPNGFVFEDILFHIMAVAQARSIGFLNSRSFTYFHRQLRAQLTTTSGRIRFDVIATVGMAFALFESHHDFDNPAQRSAVAMSGLRLLKWCEEHIPLSRRRAFRHTLRHMLRGSNPLYWAIPDGAVDPLGRRAELSDYAREVLA